MLLLIRIEEKMQGKINNRKECFIIKQITKQEIQKLLDAGILRNTHRGYVNRKGNQVGYYRTTGVGHKRYIQDWYADKAKKL